MNAKKIYILITKKFQTAHKKLGKEKKIRHKSLLF